MIILWLILSTIGLLVAIWYMTSIFNSRGRWNYPRFLWKSTGHFVSWILIIIGAISLVALYISMHNLFLFLKLLLLILIVVLIIKSKFTPLEMPFGDVMGSLYSKGGLRFGGFQTTDFLERTELLENKQSGIREKIVGEAHYLVFWLHRFPEIVFFIGIIFYKNLWVALALFVAAYIFELIRFYVFGTSIFISNICRFWDWIKIPLFIITAIILWQEGNFLPLTLLFFLAVQGFFDIVATIGMLPIRLIAGRIVYKRDGHWHNVEGLAMSFVINKWRLKLFTTAEAK